MAMGVFGRLKRVAWNGLIAALAVGVAAFSRALALRPDPAVEQLLNSPDPVALAIDSLRRWPEATATSKSPLVVQAEALALFYLEISGACLCLYEVSGKTGTCESQVAYVADAAKGERGRSPYTGRPLGHRAEAFCSEHATLLHPVPANRR